MAGYVPVTYRGFVSVNIPVFRTVNNQQVGSGIFYKVKSYLMEVSLSQKSKGTVMTHFITNILVFFIFLHQRTLNNVINITAAEWLA